MSQIDKIIYLPLLFWFIILFAFLYIVIFSLFSIIIFTTVKTRILYIKDLYNFLTNITRNMNILIKSPIHFIKTESIVNKNLLLLIKK
jgi:hypothetical protein